MQLEIIRTDGPISKLCPRCGLDKALSEFATRGQGPWSPASYCRPCQREYCRAHYRRNKTKHNRRRRDNQDAYVSRNRARMYEYLIERGCVDCGNKNPVVLEFDHVRGRKQREVSVMVGLGLSWSRIMHEVAKCEIRCANCHRIKTAIQLKWKGRITAFQERNDVGR